MQCAAALRSWVIRAAAAVRKRYKFDELVKFFFNGKGDDVVDEIWKEVDSGVKKIGVMSQFRE